LIIEAIFFLFLDEKNPRTSLRPSGTNTGSIRSYAHVALRLVVLSIVRALATDRRLATEKAHEPASDCVSAFLRV
jgi:hypothetical protein